MLSCAGGTASAMAGGDDTTGEFWRASNLPFAGLPECGHGPPGGGSESPGARQAGPARTPAIMRALISTPNSPVVSGTPALPGTPQNNAAHPPPAAPLPPSRAAPIMTPSRSLPPLLPWRHAHGDPHSATLGG